MFHCISFSLLTRLKINRKISSKSIQKQTSKSKIGPDHWLKAPMLLKQNYWYCPLLYNAKGTSAVQDGISWTYLQLFANIYEWTVPVWVPLWKLNWWSIRVIPQWLRFEFHLGYFFYCVGLRLVNDVKIHEI